MVDENFVYFATVIFEGLSSGVIERFTFALAPVLDLGVYPNCFAREIIAFLVVAESINISFATMFK